MEPDIESNENRSDSNPEEEVYLGNIWGWKFSLIGLVVIILLSVWMYIRSQQAQNTNLELPTSTEQIDE